MCYSLLTADPESDHLHSTPITVLNQHQQPLDRALQLQSPPAAGWDECGSAGAAPPCVFMAHPGGSYGNGGASDYLPGLVLCGNQVEMNSDETDDHSSSDGN